MEYRKDNEILAAVPDFYKKQYSASVKSAVFRSSGLSPAINSSNSTTIRSPVSKSLGIS